MNILDFIEGEFDSKVLPALKEFIEIPNCSPDYDNKWNENGLQDQAAAHLLKWANSIKLQGLSLQVHKDEGKTPFILGEIASFKSTVNESILFYGHFDKQPPMLPWAEGLDPYKAIQRDNKLYGRGSVDDGYSFFSSLLSIKALQANGLDHPRCVLLFEGDEESGRGDVEYYIEKFHDKIGDIGLIIALDSGGHSYDQLWITTNLRGYVEGKLTVQVLDEGVHSGDGSGVVPSSFRICRQLLDRLEDSKTGAVNNAFNVVIPPIRYKEAFDSVGHLSAGMTKYPFHGQTQTVLPSNQAFQMYLNNTWLPTLCITGADGLPKASIAGNVLRPYTTLKVSVRLPPTFDSEKAVEILKDLLLSNPPYDAVVTLKDIAHGNGFNAGEVSDKLWKSMNDASNLYLKGNCLGAGFGGSIPFMGFLQEKFPKAQFVITGCLGPNSNAHGPNEYLDLTYCKRVTACVSKIVADFQQ